MVQTRSSAANSPAKVKQESPTKSSPAKRPKKESSESVSPSAAPNVKTDSEQGSPKKKQKAAGTGKEAVDRKSRARTGGSDGPNAKPGEAPSERFLKSLGSQNQERKHGLLESGEIYFVFRPRVMVDDAKSMKDVARLHMLLIPSVKNPPSGTQPHRLVLVGKKYLPKAKKSGRPDVLWGEVLEVGDDLTQLKERLGPYSYDTKTRGIVTEPLSPSARTLTAVTPSGERQVGAARVAGRGKYVLNCSPDNEAPKGSKNMSAVYKTYLAYILTAPHTLGEVQKDFHIEHEGVLLLTVKEPNAPSNNPAIRDTPANRKPKYPAPLKKLFKTTGTKFMPANPPSLLDYPGAEILIIPSTHSIQEKIEEPVVKAELEDEEMEGGGEGFEAAKAALEEIHLDEMLTSALEDSSTYGHIRTLAEKIAEGVKSTGAEVTIFQFPEILSDEVLAKMHAAPKASYPIVTPDDLKAFDGFLFGIPTRYGRAVGSASAFFDATGGLWATGALFGKFAGIFTSSASQHGGQETTALTTIPFLAHHGISYVPIGFANPHLTDNTEIVGGSAWGAAAIAGGDGSRGLTEKELAIGQFQGTSFANLLNTFVAGKAHLAGLAAGMSGEPVAAKELPAAVAEPTPAAAPYEVADKAPAATESAPTTEAATTPAASKPVAPKKKGGLFASCCGGAGNNFDEKN